MKLSTVLVTAALLFFTACGKDEQPPQQPAPEQPAPTQPQPGQPQTGGGGGQCSVPSGGSTYGYSCSYINECYTYGGTSYPLCCGPARANGYQDCYVFITDCNGGGYGTCQASVFSVAR